MSDGIVRKVNAMKKEIAEMQDELGVLVWRLDEYSEILLPVVRQELYDRSVALTESVREKIRELNLFVEEWCGDE